MANLLCLCIIFCFAFYRFVKIFNILCTCQTNTMSTYIPISRFTWTRIVRRIQNHIIYIDCFFQMDEYCMCEFFDFRVFQNFVIYIDCFTWTCTQRYLEYPGETGRNWILSLNNSQLRRLWPIIIITAGLSIIYKYYIMKFAWRVIL